MEITSFSPLIMTTDSENVAKVFEELGFEKRHTKTGISDSDVASIDLKDSNGFRVNVAHVTQMPLDVTVIRLSVRDFDEAYGILTAHGFKNAKGDKVEDTGTSKAALMMSPSGFAISLSQHIRTDEEGN